MAPVLAAIEIALDFTPAMALLAVEDEIARERQVSRMPSACVNWRNR